MALPMPITPAAISATAYRCHSPITASGIPHRHTAIVSHRIIARLPTSIVETALPATSAPMPTAPWITPTPDSPRSSRSIATTTTSTVNAPRINVCSTTKKKTVLTPGLLRTACRPSRISATRFGRPLRGVVEPLVLQAQHQHRRHHPGRPGEREHRRQVRDLDQQRRHERAEDHAHRVEHAAHHVDRGELLGRPAEQRHQRGVARAVRREGDRRHDRERVDDPVRPAGDQDRRRQQGGQAADRRWSRRAPARGGAGRLYVATAGAKIAAGTRRSRPTRPTATTPPSA